MPLAPWNNPIVISAFRVLARKTRLFGRMTTYLLFLAVGGAILKQTDFRYADSFALTYFVCLVAVQWFFSSIKASSSSMQAMKNEVTQGTFDIQRIATLSPLDILFGQLLGEPATAYLGIIASFPLGLLCALAGGIPLFALFLVYATLFSSTLLAGTTGLRSQMALADAVPGRKAAGCMTAIFWMVGWQMLTLSGLKPSTVLSIPYLTALVGLLTPLPILAALANDTPLAAIPWFGVPIPYLVLTPVAQLLITGWYFRGMQRQLIHPLSPPGGKLLSYLALIAVDVLVAGILFDQAHWTLALPARGAAFGLVHLLASLYLMTEATPHAATLHSWVWRFRQRAGLRDAWLGARSENGLMLVTFAAIGVIKLVLLVIVPALIADADADLLAAAPVLAGATATSILLLLAIGTLHQLWILKYGVEAGFLVGVVVFLALAVPCGLGIWLENQIPLEEVRTIAGLSPVFHYFLWSTETADSPLYLWPMLIGYSALLVLGRVGIRRQLRAMERTVNATLKEMKVSGP
jgi:hypothetical protein